MVQHLHQDERRVEQKILEYLHNEEPKKWDEVPVDPEPVEPQEVKEVKAQ